MIHNAHKHKERSKQSSFIVATKTKSIIGSGSKKEKGGLLLTELNHKKKAPIPTITK